MCGTARLGSFLALVAMISLPAVVEAQFNYTTNNGSITITGYTGSGGAVTTSNTINGLPGAEKGTNAMLEFGTTGGYKNQQRRRYSWISRQGSASE